MLDWLIVGGGVHGTHLSNILIHKYGVPADRLAVLDPFDEPMERWRHCTSNTGMTHLRSPVVHHLGLKPMGLKSFSTSRAGRQVASFRPPYDRPSLKLFEAHCTHLCESGGLCSVRRKGRAHDLRSLRSGGFEVETNQGALQARRIVLAMGSGETPSWPRWAERLKKVGGNVRHIFEDEFCIDSLGSHEEVVIVGLGISAAQLANRLAQRQDGAITVLSRHEIRVHQFDSEPCWLGPKCQAPFRKLTQYEKRRQAIEKARHRGSMTQDVARQFRQRLQWGGLRLRSAAVESTHLDQNKRMELRLSDGECLSATAVVLATGFESPRPDKSWLAGAIESMELACASCGFPIVDEALQWREGLHVSGPLAELELGPAARNIAGARMTGRRLAHVIAG